MTSQYPPGMSSADMDHVEGVGMDSHTYEARVWITYRGDLPEQTGHALAKNIERVLQHHLDFTSDQIEVEVDLLAGPSPLDPLMDRPQLPADQGSTVQINRIDRLT